MEENLFNKFNREEENKNSTMGIIEKEWMIYKRYVLRDPLCYPSKENAQPEDYVEWCKRLFMCGFAKGFSWGISQVSQETKLEIQAEIMAYLQFQVESLTEKSIKEKERIKEMGRKKDE